MRYLKNFKINLKYDLSVLIKPLMLLSFISAVIYALKLLGVVQADKVFFVCIVLTIVPIIINYIKNTNNKLTFVMLLFVFIILYLYLYEDMLIYLANKCKNNGVIFGFLNAIFNTFGLTDFESLIYHTSYGGAKLINGEISTGAIDIYMLNQNSQEASVFLCGRYFSLFSALGIALSIKKHKKAILFITLFSLLSGNMTIYLLTLLFLYTQYYFIFLLFNFISFLIANLAMINGGFAVNSSVFELFVYCNNYIYILAIGLFLCAVSYYFSRLAKEKLRW